MSAVVARFARSSTHTTRLFVSAAALAAATVLYSSNKNKDNNSNNSNNNNNGKNSGNNHYGSKLTLGAASVFQASKTAKPDPKRSKADYQKVYNAIAIKLRDEDEYDNFIGYGPILTRLAWHSSGTFDKNDGSGGSFGGTMRFGKEQADGANKGLPTALKFLDPILKEFPWISHGDLFTLGGVTAVQEAQGPKIPWRCGRLDQTEAEGPANGRLPEASHGASYVRDFFKRLNFNDREVVALMGAHALGKTHLKNSGYEGPWGAASNVFTNEFFLNLLQENWKLDTNAAGNKQYDSKSGYMMLPTDYALVQDPKYLPIVKEFAKDEGKFFKDFTAAFVKLLENGITYPKNGQPSFLFQTLEEQGL